MINKMIRLFIVFLLSRCFVFFFPISNIVINHIVISDMSVISINIISFTLDLPLINIFSLKTTETWHWSASGGTEAVIDQLINRCQNHWCIIYQSFICHLLIIYYHNFNFGPSWMWTTKKQDDRMMRELKDDEIYWSSMLMITQWNQLLDLILCVKPNQLNLFVDVSVWPFRASVETLLTQITCLLHLNINNNIINNSNNKINNIIINNNNSNNTLSVSNMWRRWLWWWR